jgi:hypothetical protein
MQLRVFLAWAFATIVFSASDWKVGQRFQILLSAVPDVSRPANVVPQNAPVFDVDLFDAEEDVIKGLKKLGKSVICYFSAGTYESWRPDNKSFLPADLGMNYTEWPNEAFLDFSSKNVRNIMTKRINLAATKGCDAIDPDNIGMTQLWSLCKVTFRTFSNLMCLL